MKVKYERFLQAMKASLENKKVDWSVDFQPTEWLELFRLAETHHVLPMIYEAVYNCPSARNADRQLFMSFKQKTLKIVTLQIVKSREFLSLLSVLQNAGITPLVMKGIICRELYPNPDYRMSADEDVLIPAAQFELCHQAMMDYGMELIGSGQDINAAYEVSYGRKGSPIYIELHKQLFPSESEAYGELNGYFDGVFERAIEAVIQGIEVPTMGYTDHLFYLLCHSFKHFLHSGFGIRQVCDICLYANTYGSKIDWQCILKQCREIHAAQFTAAIFRIGQKYLTFDPVKACYPREWTAIDVDETAMLEDLLASGVYGASSMSRKHSSNITLNAMSAEKQGKKSGYGILKTVFPSAEMLSGRYPYLKERPYLLPVAWAERIIKYRKETTGNKADNNVIDSIKIGNERVELMRKYGIIDKK